MSGQFRDENVDRSNLPPEQMTAHSGRVVGAEEVLGKDWELPEGFEWEYRDALDGGGSQSVGPNGERHSQVILPTRSRRAVGPWEVVRERTVFDSADVSNQERRR